MKITTDQYKKALASPGVLKDGDVILLNYLFEAPQSALSAPMLSHLMGRGSVSGPANATLGNLGKRIAKNLALELPKREINNPGWWQVIAHGEDRPEGFFWEMRPELADALIDLDMLDEDLKLTHQMLVPSADAEERTPTSVVSNNWTPEELEAAVSAYIEMREKDSAGFPFSKNSYYKRLALEHDRTEKSFEYRMQNISYVYSLMGRRWVTGLKPARNVGSRVACEIVGLINKIEGQAPSTQTTFLAKVNENRRKKSFFVVPLGNKEPNKNDSTATQYQRCDKVAGWVLNEAEGICEKCGHTAPFIKEDGLPYLEVHHLRRLADGGSDTVTNAVAVCPNCHMELHYGTGKAMLTKMLCSQVSRLIYE